MLTSEAIEEMKIELTVNGQERGIKVKPSDTLVRVLRDRLDLTGTKVGCKEGECGACTVIVDGKPVLSCLTLAIECNGSRILTVEGLGDPENDGLHPIQAHFIEHHGLQCGFCTPGVIMSVYALLEENPNPTDEEIKKAISGNLCRCSAYDDIIRSIKGAAGE